MAIQKLAYLIDKLKIEITHNKRMQSDKVPATRALCR